jgi:acyl-CoA synthetase (AMP-forming)/AMP-acid ligase II
MHAPGDRNRKRFVADDVAMELSGVPTFAGRWRRAVTTAGDRPFLLWEGSDGAARQWSYAEFDELVGEVAVFLSSRGVQRGKAVHVARCPIRRLSWRSGWP